MAVDDGFLDLYEEQRGHLYRLAILLGAGDESSAIVRLAFISLHRRIHRIIDPQERIEYLREQVVHLARAASEGLSIPTPADGRYVALIDNLRKQDFPNGEVLVVSHFLAMFGPELSRIMRMSVHRSNQRLEAALHALALSGDGDEQVDALSTDLAAALRSAAEQIKVPPSTSIEPALRDAESKPERGTVRAQLVAVASIVALALGAIVAVATQREPLAAPQVTDPTVVASPSPSTDVALQAVIRDAPMYFVGRSDGKLYREFRDIPSTASLVRSGAESLIVLAPRDPDYISLWTGKVHSVKLSDGVLTVDMGADTYQNIDPARSHAAAAQMVYTMTELLGSPGLAVRFLADGGPAPAPFNDAAGFRRRGLEAMPGLWITSPNNQGTAPPGTLTIEGTVKPEFGAPTVTIKNAQTQQVVAKSIAQTGLTKNEEGWLLWSVSLPLTDEGSYEVSASASTSGAVAGQPTTVSETKMVRVTE